MSISFNKYKSPAPAPISRQDEHIPKVFGYNIEFTAQASFIVLKGSLFGGYNYVIYTEGLKWYPFLYYYTGLSTDLSFSGNKFFESGYLKSIRKLSLKELKKIKIQKKGKAKITGSLSASLASFIAFNSNKYILKPLRWTGWFTANKYTLEIAEGYGIKGALAMFIGIVYDKIKEIGTWNKIKDTDGWYGFQGNIGGVVGQELALLEHQVFSPSYYWLMDEEKIPDNRSIEYIIRWYSFMALAPDYYKTFSVILEKCKEAKEMFERVEKLMKHFTLILQKYKEIEKYMILGKKTIDNFKEISQFKREYLIKEIDIIKNTNINSLKILKIEEIQKSLKDNYIKPIFEIYNEKAKTMKSIRNNIKSILQQVGKFQASIDNVKRDKLLINCDNSLIALSEYNNIEVITYLRISCL